MRFFLRQLVDQNRVPGAYEIRLFGDLTKESDFAVSDAVALEASEKRTFMSPSGHMWFEEACRPGCIFEGKFHSRSESHTPETIAFITSLLSINCLGRRSHLGYGLVDVCVNASEIVIEKIYDDSESQLSSESVFSLAFRWIPLVRERTLAYFARKGDSLKLVSPRAFERIIAEAFRADGFDVQLTPESRDGGYDVLAIRHKEHTGDEVVVVECKRYADHRKVGIEIVRQLVGVVCIQGATRGVIVTTASFSKLALTTARKVGLTLIDLAALKDWIRDVCSSRKAKLL